MTKQRKMYAAFLGLAAVAFVCDRVFFAPEGAGAAPVVEGSGSESPAAPKSAAAKADAAPTGPSLSVKLQAAAPKEGSSRDPFRRGEAVSTEKAAGAGPLTDPTTPAEFQGRFELQSVLKPHGASGTAVAIVAKRAAGAGERSTGRAYAVGKDIAGWVLVGVEDKSATFERGSLRVSLELKASAKVDNREVTHRMPSN